MIDLMGASLVRICQEPGCPGCTARRQAEERYIDSILWEGVTDAPFRAKLRRTLGLCPAHAWALQAAEDTQWHDGLGTALIYQDLARQVLEALQGPAAGRTGWRDVVGRLVRQLWPPSPRQLLARLSPRQNCPVCDIGQGAELRFIHTLLAGYQAGEVRAAFQASAGLCLGHLRQALAQADQAAAAFLVDGAIDRLRHLVDDLAEYERKHAWQFHQEPKGDREQFAWIRAVAFFAGEAAGTAGDSVYAHRRRALEIFQAGPVPSPEPHPQPARTEGG